MSCVDPSFIRLSKAFPTINGEDERILNNCSLDISTDNWTTPSNTNCPETLQRVLFNSGGFQKYNPDNLAGISRIMTDAWNLYFKQDSIPGIKDILIETCKGLPGACNDVMNEICSGCNQNDLIKNPDDAVLCGCFIPDPDTGTVNRCNPLCNNPKSIRSEFDPVTGEENGCNESLCIIDNLAINVASSESNVEVNINQVCSQCNKGNCLCYIDFDDFDATKVKINVQNQCGETVCVQTDDAGNKVKFDCPKDLTVVADQGNDIRTIVSVSVALFVLAVCMFIIYALT
jgi:hypothetical protein